MKDGRFHLKYKAEHAVDLDTELIVAAEVYHGDVGDTTSVEDTVMIAQTHLREAGTDCEIQEVVADKGYHGEETLDALQNESNVRTYIPESARKGTRTWTDKSPRRESSYRRNRRNTLGPRGRRLQRLRSERVERSFAHLCDTGGSRRTWLRGLQKVRKRYLSAVMAYNLGRIMRKLIGAGKPRYATLLAERLCFIYFHTRRLDEVFQTVLVA
jgi:transposase